MATGDGGACFGDSGGPNFFTHDGTRLVVAITITGDAVCRATNVVYRLDTESARQFLAPFVALTNAGTLTQFLKAACYFPARRATRVDPMVALQV